MTDKLNLLEKFRYIESMMEKKGDLRDMSTGDIWDVLEALSEARDEIDRLYQGAEKLIDKLPGPTCDVMSDNGYLKFMHPNRCDWCGEDDCEHKECPDCGDNALLQECDSCGFVDTLKARKG